MFVTAAEAIPIVGFVRLLNRVVHMHSQNILSRMKNSAACVYRLAPALIGFVPLLAFCLPASAQPAPAGGGGFLDAKFCSDTLNLNPGSTYDNGACQLWKLAPDTGGWSRLQLKENGKYLDAKQCSDELNMNPGSTYDNGSCQLWKLVPATDGWSRVQIKRNGKLLSAANCADIELSEDSADSGADWQLWRLVPDADGWSRLQIKCTAAPSGDEFVADGQTYGWYDDGWNGPGWYIVGFEFRRGRGFGGREGWHNWHHHGSHGHHGGEHHGGEHHGGEHHGGEHHGGEHHGGEHRGGEHHGVEHHGGQHRSVSHHGGGGNGGGHGGGHGGGGRHRSDIRLKHDIVLLGHLDNGLGFYRFSYNGSNKVYVGVMAQEVVAVMPKVVSRDRDGYLVVDYDQLGLHMETWTKWVAAGQRVPTTASIRH